MSQRRLFPQSKPAALVHVPDMGDLPAFPEIDHCLLIYDDRHEDEGAADVELVLFFWPNHVDIGKYVLFWYLRPS